MSTTITTTTTTTDSMLEETPVETLLECPCKPHCDAMFTDASALDMHLSYDCQYVSFLCPLCSVPLIGPPYNLPVWVSHLQNHQLLTPKLIVCDNQIKTLFLNKDDYVYIYSLHQMKGPFKEVHRFMTYYDAPKHGWRLYILKSETRQCSPRELEKYQTSSQMQRDKKLMIPAGYETLKYAISIPYALDHTYDLVSFQIKQEHKTIDDYIFLPAKSWRRDLRTPAKKIFIKTYPLDVWILP